MTDWLFTHNTMIDIPEIFQDIYSFLSLIACDSLAFNDTNINENIAVYT